MTDEAEGGQDRTVSRRFAEVEDELRQGDRLLSLMAEQWRGMAGMAGMFVATIALAMYIRPYYDVGELHAFGASGATQARYVAVELIAIFAFTALIIYLAKRGMDYIIKYGMYVVLSLALLYTMVPLAHMAVLDFDTEPFDITDTHVHDGAVLGTWNDNGFITANISDDNLNTTVEIAAWDISNGYSEPVWTMQHAHNIADTSSPVRMTTAATHLSFASGAYAWSVDIDTGELLESYDCFEWDENGEAVPLDNMFGGCAMAVMTDDAVYLTNAFDEMLRYRTFEQSPGVLGYEARWRIPGFSTGDGAVLSQLLSNDQWMIVTPSQAAGILLEEETEAFGLGPGGMENATYLYQYAVEEGSEFTSADVGWSPFLTENISDTQADPEARLQRMILLGQADGTITGVEWNGTYGNGSAYVVQERMQLDGLVDTVHSVRLTDLDESGYSDMLIADDADAYWLYTTSLLNRATFPVPENSTHVFFAIDDDTTSLVAVQSNATTTDINYGELTTSMFPLYGLQLLLIPTLVGLALTGLLLVLLVVHSEWYVVNTTGVLLGAGVCVMLGVTFVPVLAMLFMMLAAIYDFWAVYKSKHMLDLADTMIGLRLPILLVAPQDRDYSLIEETERAKAPAKNDAPAPRKTRPAKKQSEAMFMGLGDVIFPGMLVLSAMQWLDPSVAFQVAMTTLLGGLLGYLALMTYVARGKAQAGLPLLNGGAILGYLLGGLLFLGTEILRFNISW
ncbi:MAG: presenilin family intramembrane aspartyl protease PSH [Candidatus Poseidonia sp.]|nr:presenilin family intramembrane aspartyl protease PSH [Poseidonia sp.]